ncbi:hypothetical protein HKX48_007900 [Thoreauomyces humboldtii]|nr:hypothetical protein HKX48_007900 [Thoreauomyces humboldtii]
MTKRNLVESDPEDKDTHSPFIKKKQTSRPSSSTKQGKLDGFFKLASSPQSSGPSTPTKSVPPSRVSQAASTVGTWSSSGERSSLQKLGTSSSSSSSGERGSLQKLASIDGAGIRKEMIAKSDRKELSPISELPDMFADLVQKMPLIADVARRLNGRKLRVATMCSGTESPLLALNLISRAIKDKYNVNLEIEHVFSCEIEPFKQAYIERNFAPPLLFRDVCELGNDEATTAYGALHPVPGNVDMLIAGTSCVDFSNLNNKKKTLTEGGESGKTFRGMLAWVAKHRPSIVILENVQGADWDGSVQPAVEKVKYRVQHASLDTKHYYIPCTRNRGYLFATAEELSEPSYPAIWLNTVRSLTRPATVPVEALLLQEDDPRVQEARAALVKADGNSRRGRLDWNRCEARHRKARDEEKLGQLRPLTEWQDGGVCTLLQSSWQEWGRTQTDRVLDLMDIAYIRLAVQDNTDASFKTLVWNLSQNVDRNPGSNNFGISPCLTPAMIPYITNRGGPLIGLEALSLQGLPIDELLLTRESMDQLADLAGNAMSTTVVGTCMLSALVVAMKTLKEGPSSSEPTEESNMDSLSVTRVVGEDQLESSTYDLGSCRPVGTIAAVLADAKRSARLCGCEGRDAIALAPIRVCLDCQVTSCEKCGKRPKHNYVPLQGSRISPADFEDTLKGVLPMRLCLHGFSRDMLDASVASIGLDTDAVAWPLWREATVAAINGSEFRFRVLKRQDIWMAIYEAPNAKLELRIDPVEPEWLLYVAAPSTDIASSTLRDQFSRPVARMTLSPNATGFLDGTWSIYLPIPKVFHLTIAGKGELVPSWKARIGAQGGLENEKWWSSIAISDVPEDAKAWLDRDLSGTFTLFEKCGTAMCALHKKDGDDVDADGKAARHPLLFFLDPTRAGKPDEDPFVFSTNARSLAYEEVRVMTARLDASWRPSEKIGPQKVRCYAPVRKMPGTSLAFAVPATPDAVYALPAAPLSVDMHTCDSATMLMACSVSLAHVDPIWPSDGEWRDIELLQKGRKTFKELAWITERLPGFTALHEWMDMGEVPRTFRCEACAPTPPAIRWQVDGKKRVQPVEDPTQAGPYEQALKHRPQPFVAQLNCEDRTTGRVRIGVNVATLAHRALANLRTDNDRPNPATIAWRLTSNELPPPLPPLTFSSNKKDLPNAQPPHFRNFPLRPEQLRSLTWMLAQEKDDVPAFVEEEVAESVLEPLRWRVEARAEREVNFRGGVLADQVGYGKTAITLGLIDCAPPANPLPSHPGLISLKATLIVVPAHLCKQWPSEIRKFTGSHFKTLTIENIAGLNKLTIQDFLDADIIVVSSRMLTSNNYWDRLAAFSGGDLPTTSSNVAGRRFLLKYEAVLAKLRKQIELLTSGIPDAVDRVWDNVQIGRQHVETDILQPSKRKSAKEHAENVDDPMEVDEPSLQDSEDGESSDDDDDDAVEVASGSKRKAPAERPKRTIKKRIVISEDEDELETPEAASEEDYDPDAGDADAADDEYEVEKILDDGTDERGPVYFIKWKGYPIDDATWEPIACVAHLPELIADWHDEKNAPKRMKSKSPAVDLKGKGPAKSKSKAVSISKKPVAKKPAAKKPVDKAKAIKVEKPLSKADFDPWELRSRPVKAKWTQMKHPNLEMFHFRRLVMDEFTYLEGRIHASLTHQSADFKWILSGTPPHEHFGQIKGIAAFLGINLGIDEHPATKKEENAAQATSTETFLSFREIRSPAWHARRHEVAQIFLDQFVRQNIAEIDEIPAVEHEHRVVLPAAERAIYLELEHHLQAMEMDTRRTLKTHGDKERRLREAMGSSKTAEEALLKRCSHFDLHVEAALDKKGKVSLSSKLAPVTADAREACEVIVAERKAQLEECREALLACLIEANRTHKSLASRGAFREGPDFLSEWQGRWIKGQDVGDPEAVEIFQSLLEEAGVAMGKGGSSSASAVKSQIKSFYDKMSSAGTAKGKPKAKPAAKGKGKAAAKKKPAKNSDSEDSAVGTDDEEEELEEIDDGEPVKAKKKTTLADDVWELRETVHNLRRQVKELTGRVRSLRYFTLVRDLQQARLDGRDPASLTCPGPDCTREGPVPHAELAVLSCCGHTGCSACLMEEAANQRCALTGCDAPARTTSVVLANVIGVDTDGTLSPHGKKLSDLVALIEGLPTDDRVLVFVQFDDLMTRVAGALESAKISFLQVIGSTAQQSTALATFQGDLNSSGNNVPRVLLLNVMSESASGANLTVANHVVFLSPLLAESQQEYTAAEVQAIGRVRRYGQKKIVHIHRFLSEDTMDTQIYEQRERTVLS